MSRCLALKVVVGCWVASSGVVSAQFVPAQPAVIEIPIISEIISGTPATASVTISNREQPALATIGIAGGVIEVTTSPRFPDYLNGIRKFELIPSTILARASYDQNTGVLSVRGTGLTEPLTVSDIVNAISTRPQLSASISYEAFGNTEVPLASIPTVSLTKVGRSAGSGSLFIESEQAGRASDFELVFGESEQITAAPSAVYDSEIRKIHVTVDGVVPTTLTSIASVIDSLEEFSVPYSSLGDGLYDPLMQSPSDVEAFYLGGFDPVTSTGLAQVASLRLSGPRGIEVFEFDPFSVARDIAQAINATRDTTGVVATSAGANLQVSSVAVGADAFVEIEVLQDGDGPTAGRPFSQALGAGLRVYGSDAIPEPSATLIFACFAGLGVLVRHR